MKIRWLGHSCFHITTPQGVRILTDPFDAHVGYPLPTVVVDIVTISHQHGDHNNTGCVLGNFTVIDTPGVHTVKGVEIQGFPTFHDKTHGSARGKNIVYKISAGGQSVLHCGDLGHLLDAQQIAEIGPVDVLLVPVGGRYTIDHQDAAELVRRLQPAVTIPMHYKTPSVDFPIAGVEPFVEALGGGQRLDSDEVDIDGDQAGIIVLKK